MNEELTISERYKKLRQEVPQHVSIVVAAKKRTPQEITELIDAGAEFIGENYVQEAEAMYQALGERAGEVKWHMIGELQKNKINKALKIFDLFESIDSEEHAEALNLRAERTGKEVQILIEINVGSEITKSGVKPEFEEVERLARSICGLKNIRLKGLMTMGPRTGDPEGVRPYFRKVKEIFDRLKELDLPDTDMDYLSMGMSNSYKIAVEEGANMIRPGTLIFGSRD